MKFNKGYIFCIISIVMMIVIFSFSNQNGETSYGVSSFVLDILKNININIDKHIPLINNSADYTLRKIAHITLYFILGIFVSCSTLFIKKNGKGYHIFGISSIICFMYACLDEFHQTFINGRTGQFKDVGYDAIGFVSAILLVISINKIITRHKQKN